jgi:hypothetical protein
MQTTQLVTTTQEDIDASDRLVILDKKLAKKTKLAQKLQEKLDQETQENQELHLRKFIIKFFLM